MTEQERLHIRAELARRMGWTCITGDVGFNPETSHQLAYCSEAFKKAICSQMKKPIPNPFTNAADCRALVAWICSDKSPATFDDEAFLSGISKIYGQLKTPYSKRELACAMWDTFTAPLETITLAAARALGIPEAANGE